MSVDLNNVGTVKTNSPSFGEDADRLKAKLNQAKIQLATAEDEKEKEKLEKVIEKLEIQLRKLDGRNGSDGKTEDIRRPGDPDGQADSNRTVVGIDEAIRNAGQRRKEDDPRRPGYLFDRVA